MPKELTDKTNLTPSSQPTKKDVRELLKPLNLLLKAKDVESKRKAVALTKQACTLRPKDSWCYLQAARALRAYGFNDRALKALKQAEVYSKDGNVDSQLISQLQKAWQTCAILTLPDELLVHVMLFLSYRDVARVQRTCKRLNAVARTHSEVWRCAPREFVYLNKAAGRQLDRLATRMREVLRRADGKMFEFGLKFLKLPGPHEEWFIRDPIEVLHLIPFEQLRTFKVDLALVTMQGDAKRRLQNDVMRLCRGANLQSLTLNVGTMAGYAIPDPTLVWPHSNPPIRQLTLVGSSSLFRKISWLRMTQSTLETLTYKMLFILGRDEEKALETDLATICFPKLQRLEIDELWDENLSYCSTPRLALPALRYLRIGDYRLDRSGLSDLLVPSLSELSINVNTDMDAILCAALPSMMDLEKIYIDYGLSVGGMRAIEVLTQNQQIPVRQITLSRNSQTTGEDLVRLCLSREAPGCVKVDVLKVIGCMNILPDYAKWLRNNVRDVQIVGR